MPVNSTYNQTVCIEFVRQLFYIHIFVQYGGSIVRSQGVECGLLLKYYWSLRPQVGMTSESTILLIHCSPDTTFAVCYLLFHCLQVTAKTLPVDIKNGIRNLPERTRSRKAWRLCPSNGRAPHTSTYKTTPRLWKIQNNRQLLKTLLTSMNNVYIATFFQENREYIYSDFNQYTTETCTQVNSSTKLTGCYDLLKIHTVIQ